MLDLLLSKGQELTEFEVSELSVDELASEEVELLDESSFFAQEMMVRLKNVDSKMKKIFFIFSSIQKNINVC